MSVFLNPLFFILFLVGIIFYFSAILLIKRPPRKINHIYGYRSKNSKASQERWDFAQIYSSSQMKLHGIYLCLVALASLFVRVNFHMANAIAIIIITIAAVSLIWKVEQGLKEKFGELE